MDIFNLKLHVYRLLGEQTNHSENEWIYYPKIVWHVERNSSGDIDPMSYHLAAFELINQSLYINFAILERNIFLKDPKFTLRSSVALWFCNSCS